MLIRTTVLFASLLAPLSAQNLNWIQNPANGHYYAETASTMTWTQAEALAVAYGGHLATVRSAAENTWLHQTFSGVFWIGFNDAQVEGQWVWSSGEPVSYTNWGPSQPDNAGNEDYAHGGFGLATWNDWAAATFIKGVLELPSMPVLSWSQPSNSAGPSPRSTMGMAYDEAREQTVLFGGFVASGPVGDTWTWDGDAWTQRSPASNPPARNRFAMAYDSLRQRVVLFGGSGTAGLLSDTWEWDGTTWLPQATAVMPSARADCAMAYDEVSQRIVLFGGNDASGARADTWTWDGATWTPWMPASAPPARGDHVVVYDPNGQGVLLFGGRANGTVLADTWLWSGGTWIAQLSLSFPPGRWHPGLAFDREHQVVTLFGGTDGAYRDDTWIWDGSAWAPVTTTSQPTARSGFGMVWHDARQQLVAFGGGNGGFLGDTWTSDHAGASTYGAGCGNPPLTFEPVAGQRPILGQQCGATIDHAPLAIGGVAMGWSRATYGPFLLPVALSSIGMPGCDLWQSADVLGLVASPLSATSMSFSYAVPAVPSLIGGHVYLQAYAVAPGENPAWLIASNGIDWRLGIF